MSNRSELLKASLIVKEPKTLGIVSPAEGDAIVLKGHETMVGDGDAMGIAGQIVEHLFRAAEGRS